MDYDSYKDARADWQAVSTDQTKFLDQANLTLAGGTLGLCITFLHNFAAPPRLTSQLYFGGTCLIASVVLTLASIHMSQHSIERYIRKLDDAARADFSAESLKFLRGKYVNMAARITFWLNAAASVALITGIVFVSIFAYNNLSVSDVGVHMTQKNGPGSLGILQKGTVPMAPAVARPTPQPAPAQSNQTQDTSKK